MEFIKLPFAKVMKIVKEKEDLSKFLTNLLW